MSDFEEHLGSHERLVIAFSSRPHHFDWRGTLSRLGLSYVLMRDSTERWFRHGVDGIGDLWSVVDYVMRASKRYQTTRTLGLSSGAYAALLFGQLAEVDEVIAISPITGKGESAKADFPPEWHHRIEHGPEHPPVLDLKRVFRCEHDVIVKAFVSDGPSTELDAEMCHRIGLVPTLIPGHSHAGLAKYLRDYGLIAGMVLNP